MSKARTAMGVVTRLQTLEVYSFGSRRSLVDRADCVIWRNFTPHSDFQMRRNGYAYSSSKRQCGHLPTKSHVSPVFCSVQVDLCLPVSIHPLVCWCCIFLDLFPPSHTETFLSERRQWEVWGQWMVMLVPPRPISMNAPMDASLSPSHHEQQKSRGSSSPCFLS